LIKSVSKIAPQGDDDDAKSQREIQIEKENFNTYTHMVLYFIRTVILSVMTTSMVYFHGNKNNETRYLVMACTVALTSCAYFIDIMTFATSTINLTGLSVLGSVKVLVGNMAMAAGVILPTILYGVLMYVIINPKQQADVVTTPSLSVSDPIGWMGVAAIAELTVTFGFTLILALINKFGGLTKPSSTPSSPVVNETVYGEMHLYFHVIEHLWLFSWTLVFMIYAQQYLNVAEVL
jgi:hypothetical protein